MLAYFSKRHRCIAPSHSSFNDQIELSEMPHAARQRADISSKDVSQAQGSAVGQDINTNDESSEALFCEKNNHNLISDDIRDMFKTNFTREPKRQILSYIFGKKGAVEEGKIRQAVLIFGGAGSGKSTLMQTLPELKKYCQDSRVFVDENAGGNRNQYIEEYIPLMRRKGIDVKVFFIGCAIMEAFERNSTRAKTYDDDEVILSHRKAQDGFLEMYEKFGDPKEKKGFSFEGIRNPKTPHESGEGEVASPSLEHVKKFSGDIIYDHLNRERILAFGDKKSDDWFIENFGFKELHFVPRDRPKWLPKRDASFAWEAGLCGSVAKQRSDPRDVSAQSRSSGSCTSGPSYTSSGR